MTHLYYFVAVPTDVVVPLKLLVVFEEFGWLQEKARSLIIIEALGYMETFYRYE